MATELILKEIDLLTHFDFQSNSENVDATISGKKPDI